MKKILASVVRKILWSHQFKPKCSILRAAAERGELVMYYQPKVDMTNSTLIGVEALLRWNHPKHGLLPPALFSQATKFNDDVIIDLGHWAIQTVVKQISEWGKEGLKIPVSVNIMASELISGDFCAWLQDLLDQYPGVNHTMLELEIVESSNLSDPMQVVEVISKCRQAGVKIALDDFGTAYSSLSYVRNVPSDHVKIDKTFVKDIVCNHQDRGLVQLVISLAHSFDRKVIAEGVESIDHGLVLLSLGCKYGQGYVIGHPMAAADFTTWLYHYKGYPEWEGRLTHALQPALFN